MAETVYSYYDSSAWMKNKRKLSIYIGLAIILLSIPLTILILQRRADVRTEAQIPEPAFCPLPLDIMLVMDSSSSMWQFNGETGGRKLDEAINAAKTLVDQAIFQSGDGRRNRVGILWYNRQGGVVSDLSSDKAGLNQSLEQFRTDSKTDGTPVRRPGTNIDAGISLAHTTLSSARITPEGKDKEQVMIVLTDGRHNNPNFSLQQLFALAEQAKNDNIQIFTIGFGKRNAPSNDPDSGIDESALKTIASDPVNGYKYGTDQAQLEQALKEINDIAYSCGCFFYAQAMVLDADSNEPIKDIHGFRTGSVIYDAQDQVTQECTEPNGCIELFDKNGEAIFSSGSNEFTGSSTKNSVKLYQEGAAAEYDVVSTFCVDPLEGQPLYPGSTDPRLKDVAYTEGCADKPGYYTTPPPFGGKGLSIVGQEGPVWPPDYKFENFKLTCNKSIQYGWKVRKQTQNQPPLCVATVTPDEGLAPFAATFDGTGSSDPEGGVLTYSWVISDGFTSSQETFPHTTQNPGDYVAGLTVTDDEGETAYCEVPYKVAPLAPPPGKPVCQIETIPSPATGQAPLTVQFDGTASQDTNPGGALTGYLWQIQNGPTFTTPTFSHVFTEIGSSTVTLVVTNDRQLKSDACTVTVTTTANQPPICAIKTTPDPAKGSTPLTVSFDGTGSNDPDGSIVSYNWSITDGTTSNQPTFTNIFSIVGSFIANLIITDNDGNSASCSKPITIEPTGGPPPVTYYDCDLIREACVQRTSPDGTIPPDAINCGGNDSICQSHYECSSQDTCERIGGPGNDECDLSKDCLNTYFTCDLNACVEVYGDKADTCSPNEINACKEPTPPETGVSGAALAIALITTTLFISGIVLLY